MEFEQIPIFFLYNLLTAGQLYLASIVQKILIHRTHSLIWIGLVRHPIEVDSIESLFFQQGDFSTIWLRQSNLRFRSQIILSALGSHYHENA